MKVQSKAKCLFCNSGGLTCILYVHRVTCYVEQMSAWYDAKTKTEVMNIKVFEKLEVESTSVMQCLFDSSTRKISSTFVDSVVRKIGI